MRRKLTSFIKYQQSTFTSTYRRQLPEAYIRLNTIEGKLIFKEALADGGMECYFPLAEQFTTQSDPETCGPTSLVMVLNSLSVDPGKPWKGIWRWYSEDNLNMITKEILKTGIDLQSWTHVAQHNQLDVMTFYHPKADGPSEDRDSCEIHRSWIYRTARYDTFLDCMLSSSRRDGFVLTLNHSRKRMGQTGDGHYSPIGGYHKVKRLALMLDVARYKYPSYWCDTNRLFESLEDMDKSTNKPRGFVLISRKMDNTGGVCRATIDYPFVKLFHEALVSVREKLSENSSTSADNRSNQQNQCDSNGFAKSPLTNSQEAFIHIFFNMFTHQLRSLVVYYLFEFQCQNSPQDRALLFERIREEPLFHTLTDCLTTTPKTQNYHKLQSLMDDFTLKKSTEMFFLFLVSLPRWVFHFGVSNPEFFLPHVKLFRKCFVILLEEPVNRRFE